METHTALLEIGCEELPAGQVEQALEQLAELVRRALAEERLAFSELQTCGTPRRLALMIEGLVSLQEPQEEVVRGPAAKVAYDQEGRPTKAAQGFARSQGLAVADLVERDTSGGRYVYAVRTNPGRPAPEVLARVFPAIISLLTFTRPMRWGEGDFRFIRPIRWLVALYGDRVIPFQLAGITSGRTTRGHRFLAPEAVTIPRAEEYLTRLRQASVVADQRQRRQEILRQLQEVAALAGGSVTADEELLTKVTHLVEYPTAMAGSFPEEYLELPSEVLVTTMKEHQSYFPLRDSQGRLKAGFVAVRNGGSEHLDTVRRGNERVLRARLADARFFYQEDLKTTLVARLPDLRGMVFQERLGSMADKVQRLQRLAAYVAEALGLADHQRQLLLRASSLAKADLTSHMVYEFPELQGVMGYYYALNDGEDAEVALAIRQQYLPRWAGDQLPTSTIGLVLSLADRMDTVTGFFAAGLRPSGSRDPFALRRQAHGACLLLLAADRGLSLRDLGREAYRLHQGQHPDLKPLEEVEPLLEEFFRGRLGGILEDRGFSRDLVAAVLTAGWEDPADALSRAEALAALRGTESHTALSTTFTRARNLAGAAAASQVHPELLVEPAEVQLFQSWRPIKEEVEGQLTARSYPQALAALAQLRDPIDLFFQEVLVMAPDPEVRANRLALLAGIAALITRIADLSCLEGQ